MKVEKIAPNVWRISENGKTKIIRASKASIAAIESAVKKYANALKRLADK